MHPLDTFLQTGRLPTVERRAEVEAIESFHARVLGHDRIGILAVIGEAGVGKSALVDSIIAKLEGRGDVVLRLRAWSEGAGALGEQIREALRRSSQAELLIRGGIEPTLSASLGAVRRIIRLRPTLLVIEDLHLFSGEPLAELARALQTLEQEPIGVIVTARTLPPAVEGALLPWLEERMRLDGFTREQVEQVWQALMGNAPDPAVANALLDATHGNALALRSGLRAALRTVDARGLLRREGAQTRLSTAPLLDELHRQVGLLADSMIAHTSAEERTAAARLARLGEVFDPATALQLPGVSRELLESLIERGAVAPAAAPASPLLPSQRLSAAPLAFTHSLLHEALLRHSPNDPELLDALLAIVANGSTLLSLAPVWYLQDAASEGVAPNLLCAAALEIADLAASLETGVHHAHCEKILGVARHLASLAHQTTLDPALLRSLDQRIAIVSAGLHLNQRNTVEFREEIDQLLTLVAEPLDAESAGTRLAALRFLHAINYLSDYPRFDPERARAVHAEASALLDCYPELRFSNRHAEYLMTLAQTSSLDVPMLCRVEEEVEMLLDHPDASADFCRDLVREVYPFLLKQFITPEERDRRERKIEELERIDATLDLRTRFRILQFRMIVGNYDAALAMIDSSAETFLLSGLWSQYCNLRLDRTRILAAHDKPLELCEQEAERMLATAPEHVRSQARRFCGLHLAITGLLRGDAPAARRWTERYAELELLAPYERVLLLLDAGDEAGLRAEFEVGTTASDSLYGALAVALGYPLDNRLDDLRASLARPVVEIGQALARRTNLLLLSVALERHGKEHLAEQEIDPLPSLEGLLEWMAAHRLPAFGRPLLALAERFGMPTRALRSWRARFNEEPAPANTVAGGTERVRLRICGTVEALTSPDAAPVAIRGGRLRTLLGLMIAQKLLHEPLSTHEFRHIAAGSSSELDAENARKTMNAAVVRLRDLIGEESIETSGPVPTLNTVHVSIDLLEADDLLRTARQALRAGALQRAVRAVRQTLAITQGEPPFPALYEEFFEALREDFEARLRGITVDVVARLLEEGDPAGAEELAALALRSMPEDEELAEMRAGALELLGRRADAERARMIARQAELAGESDAAE